MLDLRYSDRCLWNLRINDRWYRCRDSKILIVCEIDRPEALQWIKQIYDQPDKLDGWEEAPFPAPLSSESRLVYTINKDAGTLDVTYFEETKYTTKPRTDRYDLRAVYEASSLSSVKCLENPQPPPSTQQTAGKVMTDESARPTLEPLHLNLDVPTPLNELQTRLYIHFLSVWRWHFLDPIIWRYDSLALNYFCFAILRLAAWDLEVSYDNDIHLPTPYYAVPPWSYPKDNMYWYHGFLVVLHDSLEDDSKIRPAIQKAHQFLERTAAARRRHTRLIIMSPHHIVFAEITTDDTVRASSPSMLISTLTETGQPGGFRALCGILTSNCWPDTTPYREIWRNYLPWEIILLILSHLEPHDMAAFAQVSVPVKMLYYARIRQSIPQFTSMTPTYYSLLIPCCATRSGLEQSGVMCSVCYTWKHTRCIDDDDQRHLPSTNLSGPHYYICRSCRLRGPQVYPLGPSDLCFLYHEDIYPVQHEDEIKMLSLQLYPCMCKEHLQDISCLGNVDLTIRFNGAFSGLAYGLYDQKSRHRRCHG